MIKNWDENKKIQIESYKIYIVKLRSHSWHRGLPESWFRIGEWGKLREALELIVWGCWHDPFVRWPCCEAIPLLHTSHIGHSHGTVFAVPGMLCPHLYWGLSWNKCQLARRLSLTSQLKVAPSPHLIFLFVALTIIPYCLAYVYIHLLSAPALQRMEAFRQQENFCLYPLCREQCLIPGPELHGADRVQDRKHISGLPGRAYLERRRWPVVNLGFWYENPTVLGRGWVRHRKGPWLWWEALPTQLHELGGHLLWEQQLAPECNRKNSIPESSGLAHPWSACHGGAGIVSSEGRLWQVRVIFPMKRSMQQWIRTHQTVGDLSASTMHASDGRKKPEWVLPVAWPDLPDSSLNIELVSLD